MTTGKTTGLTRWTFVGKVMSLPFNMLSSLAVTFLPRNKHLLQRVGHKLTTKQPITQLLVFITLDPPRVKFSDCVYDQNIKKN